MSARDEAVEMIRRICPPHLSADEYGRILAEKFDAHRAEVLAEADLLPKAHVVAWLVKKAREGDPIENLASKVNRGAIRPDNLRTLRANFFEPGHTYAINDGIDRISTLDWIFTVETTGREPSEHGRRVAFGYLSNRAGRQATAHIESAESWTRGWTDITDTTTGDSK